MPSLHHTVGIVIKSRTSRESDLIVTLLTPHLGKITAIAKGAKNIKSSRLGALQLGNVVKAHLYQKNGLYWLSEATAVTQFLRRHKHLTQINLLYYFLEILNYFIAENQHLDEVFDISREIINAISNDQLTNFIRLEIQLMENLGFGLPENIYEIFESADYVSCQREIRQFLESVIDKPLESSKLFS